MPLPAKRTVTIIDVAKAAGVSFKTVSRVLNNEASVSDRTREKVQKAIKALEYSPSVAARVLAGHRSFLVGLIYDTPSSYYMHSIQMGALERCRAADYHLILERCNSGARGVTDAILSLIKQTRMDGVILTPPVCDVPAVHEALAKQNIPHVMVSPPQIKPRTNCVHMDNRQAATDMTRYLISLGHRRIGFIKGHPRHGAAKLRLLGYEDALRENGIKQEARLIKDGTFRFESGVAAAEQLLQQKMPPTAIIAANDEMGAGVVTAAHRMGLSIPGDVSIAGFDDVPYASITWPPLTTIHQPIVEMGAAAAQILLDQIRPNGSALGQEFSVLSFDYTMKIRASTGPAKR
jgi:LacI family transcriptional regulator